MARRLVALLTSLLMAHLTFVAGDQTCAGHSGDAGMHHMTAHAEHAAPSVGHPATDAAPCRTPSVPMCCQALQSCTVALAVAASRTLHPTASEDDSIAASRSEFPRSEIVAPDPPPPRA